MASTPATGLDADIAALLGQFAAISADAAKVVEGLSNDQFNWRPAPERWSIAQCIGHLNAVDGQDIPPVALAIGNAFERGLTGKGPFRYGAISSWFLRKVEPPAVMKTKAPKIYVPPIAQDIEVAMAEFRRIQGRIAELVASANGLDLARVQVPTPLTRWIQFSLGQRFRLIAAHDRRHLWQAWEVRRALP